MNPLGLVRRYPDVALGVMLTLINVVSLLPGRQPHPLWGALLLAAGQSLPLIWRRGFPVPVMAVVGASRVAFDQIGYQLAPFPLGPAIALYTVFDRSGAPWRWVVGLLSAAGIAISLSSPGHDEPYQAIYQGLIFTTACAAGQLSRSRRMSLRAAEERASAESERALRAEASVDAVARAQASAERARIARDLHDVIAHHISLVAVQSEATLSLLPDRPADAEKSVAIIGDTARRALTELRRLLGVLRWPSEPLETTPSASLATLDALLTSVREAGLSVESVVTGDPFPLAPGVDIAAYRIIQEALTNTVRHSQAARANVAIDYEPGFVTVRVTETGDHRAHARAASGFGSGLGLAGIAERVAACGGSLTIGPAVGGSSGFTVVAKLPSS
ncbi:MAG TPA: sensor histidine kinase [Streptosporangiaceae bacterium]|nr:sensor histidine kinase [Streptosporangiaceae bacterium]